MGLLSLFQLHTGSPAAYCRTSKGKQKSTAQNPIAESEFWTVLPFPYTLNLQ